MAEQQHQNMSADKLDGKQTSFIFLFNFRLSRYTSALMSRLFFSLSSDDGATYEKMTLVPVFLPSPTTSAPQANHISTMTRRNSLAGERTTLKVHSKGK